MEIDFLRAVKDILEEDKPNAEVEITLDDGSIFTTSDFSITESLLSDEVYLGIENSSDPYQCAFFSLSHIHHIIVKSRNKKKLGFHLKDFPSLNKSEKLPKNPLKKRGK